MEMKHCCYARLTRNIISLPHLLSDDLGLYKLSDVLYGNEPEELHYFFHFLGEETESGQLMSLECHSSFCNREVGI